MGKSIYMSNKMYKTLLKQCREVIIDFNDNKRFMGIPVVVLEQGRFGYFTYGFTWDDQHITEVLDKFVEEHKEVTQ